MCGIGAVLGIGTRAFGHNAVKCELARKVLRVLAPRGPDAQGQQRVWPRNSLELEEKKHHEPHDVDFPAESCQVSLIDLAATVLHLRGGEKPTTQPCSDGDGNVLCFNGEIFGGIEVADGENDTVVLLGELNRVCKRKDHQNAGADFNEASIMGVFERLHGPFSFLYWQESTQTLWFGRDKLGRRSLLIAKISPFQFVISSVAIFNDEQNLSTGDNSAAWKQVPVGGIYSLPVHGSSSSFPTAPFDFGFGSEELAAPSISFHPWTPRSLLFSPQHQSQIVESSAPPSPQQALCLPPLAHPSSNPHQARFLSALSKSVALRVQNIAWRDTTGSACVGILFSGGIDCAVLALLAHYHTPPGEAIDLINVAFVGDYPSFPGASSSSSSAPIPAEDSLKNRVKCIQNVPDRVAAINTLCELRQAAPTRKWNLIEVDITTQSLVQYRDRITSLLHPRTTVMDFNIGGVLFYGARAMGKRAKQGENYSFIQSKHCRYAEEEEPSRAGLAGASPHDIEKERQRREEIRKERKQKNKEEQRKQSKIEREARKKAIKEEKRKKYLAKLAGAKNTNAASASQHTVKPEQPVHPGEDSAAFKDLPLLEPFTSKCRVLFSGLGADELLAGYGRHRTSFRKRGLDNLIQELRKDYGRLWERNLGRDDRITSDASREVRFPFLDEEFVATVSATPLPELFDLQSPAGIGDKKILRNCAYALGLKKTASLVKRAMQFGSRIANSAVSGTGRIDQISDISKILNQSFISPSRSDSNLPDAEFDKLKKAYVKRNRSLLPAQPQLSSAPEPHSDSD